MLLAFFSAQNGIYFEYIDSLDDLFSDTVMGLVFTKVSIKILFKFFLHFNDVAIKFW